jgi:hypothetical protein
VRPLRRPSGPLRPKASRPPRTEGFAPLPTVP